jgi:4-alpha-glucanotransferase
MSAAKRTGKKDSALEELARAHGIQTSYVDNVGRRQFASAETLRLILARLGAEENAELPRMIEPVAVHWQKSKSQIEVRLPADQLSEALLRLTLESGEEECIPVQELTGVRKPGRASKGIAELRLDVPELPAGYHTIAIETRSERGECMLMSAPQKLYTEGRRQWGGFIPLYAAHSEMSWGAGNFSDWRAMCDWIAGTGAKVMGTLPVMAAILDHPVCEPSPYSPASRLFWNEFFIDITAIPEFRASAAAQKVANSTAVQRKIEEFRLSEFIDYRGEWQVRRQVLSILAKEFFSQSGPRMNSMHAYVRTRPEVMQYARFRAMCEATGKSWHTWNDAAKAGNIGATQFSEEVENFYLYAQWVAQEQMDALLASCRARGLKFYLDLPLGSNPDGFDAWRYKEFFAPKVNAGAPPDSFFTKGQDWGFAPLHPQRTRELKYRYVIDYLRFQMRHTGLLRIDHVMGLHRLWWVPHGHPASAGAYVQYPADELYAILSIESHRHKTMLVGENLGTVPPEVNKSMDRHGMRRMYVLQYEQQPKGGLRTPEKSVVASVNTHDMPSFAAHWKDLDIDDRVDLGLIPKKEIAKVKREREQARKNLIAFLRRKKLLKITQPKAGDVLDAILRYLAESPAETVLVTLEDFWQEERSQNVPGTSSERPNWRRKARYTIEELRADTELNARLKKIMQR